MNITMITLLVLDLCAAVFLSFGVYYRRHHRRDLPVAFIGVNVGVMAVAAILGNAEIGMGVGLGLFGVLSIIRLRSSEISQREVAYYFAALAMGLIAGLPQLSPWVAGALILLIVVTMTVVDSPRIFSRTRSRHIKVNQVFFDEQQARAVIAEYLDGTILMLNITDIDLVNQTTKVEVRYRIEAELVGKKIYQVPQTAVEQQLPVSGLAAAEPSQTENSSDYVAQPQLDSADQESSVDAADQSALKHPESSLKLIR